MDVVNVGGKKYDPYFILDVTRDDSDEHITKSFKAKVKRYHPDRYTDPVKRKKYELYFQILSESYNYIQTKRSSTNLDTRRNKRGTNKKTTPPKSKSKTKSTTSEEKYENIRPEDFGYKCNRTKTVKEYKDFDVVNYNQFNDRKFSSKEFNKIFEYTKQQTESEREPQKQLQIIHRTTDGFNGYNSGDIGSCALISCFNGLLITGDNLGERGIGYWSDHYGDYKMSYETARNPLRKIKVPRDFTVNNNTITSRKTVTDYTRVINEVDATRDKKSTFQSETNRLYQQTYNDLVEQERLDKQFVLKYAHQYDTETVNRALQGELETSPTYTSVLHKYIQ